jgi:hypothetical protein
MIVFLIMLQLQSCGVGERLEKQKKAQADADYIMNNLENPEVKKRFPAKYFPPEQLNPFVDNLVNQCDLDAKQGKFVDYFTMNLSGKHQIAYIYEYILDCDSLRFIYTYDLDTQEPELLRFHIEGLEVPSNMIVDPGKQLLNSRK